VQGGRSTRHGGGSAGYSIVIECYASNAGGSPSGLGLAAAIRGTTNVAYYGIFIHHAHSTVGCPARARTVRDCLHLVDIVIMIAGLHRRPDLGARPSVADIIVVLLLVQWRPYNDLFARPPTPLVEPGFHVSLLSIAR